MKNNLGQNNKQKFIYPLHPYHGHDSPDNYLSNAKLQEFSAKVGFLASLHTNGKISTTEACSRLTQLWEFLEQ